MERGVGGGGTGRKCVCGGGGGLDELQVTPADGCTVDCACLTASDVSLLSVSATEMRTDSSRSALGPVGPRPPLYNNRHVAGGRGGGGGVGRRRRDKEGAGLSVNRVGLAAGR